jgi:hypothetical protein
MADSDDGYRSRSQSRRRRRQNQRQRQAASKAEAGGGANAKSMAAVQEEDNDDDDVEPQPLLYNPAPQDTTEMQPFERIKPPSQSMNGPVTYARAQRGEIPMRGGGQPQNLPQNQDKGRSSDILAQDGLKVRLELNLDIEIELKASIHGDLTLAVES